MSKRRLSPKTYTIVRNAVESGVAYGITRLFKYHPKRSMTEDEMRTGAGAVEDAVMNDLCDVIDFDGST
jgi:hypothetical protein